MSLTPVQTALRTEAESGWLRSVETSINDIANPFNEWLAGIVFWELPLGDLSLPFVVLWLIAGASIVTIYFGFLQFRCLPTSLDVVRGKFSRPDDPGEITHFQALSSAVSGTVGLGNIAGVGAAVAMGGPGATFWMIIAGLLGMATKFVECTLGVKYREIDEDGTVHGGPFKYMPVAFKKFGSIPTKILTGIFAIAILCFGVAGGGMFQANQTFVQVRNVTGGEEGFLGSDGAALIFGLILAALVGLVIIGGIKSIGKVTSSLVPFMAILYVVSCLVVIGLNAGHVPDAVNQIITGAFSPEAGLGGALGVAIVGFQRAAFSNEAGLGSAPIAHSPVKTRRPVSEGFVAMFEPFIDTVVVCTMTALTIIIADQPSFRAGMDAVKSGEGAPDGVTLTSDAFESVAGWFPYILAIAVVLFAFSTLITWSYYGQKAWHHLFGRSKAADAIYRVVFLFMVVVGCVLTFSAIVGITDSFLFICAFVNLLALFMLLPVVKKEAKEYLADRKSGRLYELAAESEEELHAIREEQGNQGDLPEMQSKASGTGEE